MTTKLETRRDNLEWGQLTPSWWRRLPADEPMDSKVKREQRARQKRAKASRKANRGSK